jgi:hypothetical protein
MGALFSCAYTERMPSGELWLSYDVFTWMGTDFQHLTGRGPTLEDAIAVIARKCAKKGLPPPVFHPVDGQYACGMHTVQPSCPCAGSSYQVHNTIFVQDANGGQVKAIVYYQ